MVPLNNYHIENHPPERIENHPNKDFDRWFSQFFFSFYLVTVDNFFSFLIFFVSKLLLAELVRCLEKTKHQFRLELISSTGFFYSSFENIFKKHKIFQAIDCEESFIFSECLGFYFSFLASASFTSHCDKSAQNRNWVKTQIIIVSQLSRRSIVVRLEIEVWKDRWLFRSFMKNKEKVRKVRMSIQLVRYPPMNLSANMNFYWCIEVCSLKSDDD